jgi:2-keto-4-pentenoate hydratase
MTGPALAARLVEARHARRTHAFQAAEEPAGSAEAYAIQADVAAGLGTEVAGWKVGFAPTPEQTPMAGPIFACDMRESGGTYRLAAGETVKVEVELALRLGADLPARPQAPYTAEEILAATQDMLVGIELVGSRFTDPDSAPFTAKLADNFNNAAYVAGEGIRDFGALDRAQLRCRLWIDGELVTDRPGGHADGDPLVPLLAWASRQVDALGGLRAGQVITTGSLNTPAALSRNALIEAELSGLGRVTLRLEA